MIWGKTDFAQFGKGSLGKTLLLFLLVAQNFSFPKEQAPAVFVQNTGAAAQAAGGACPGTDPTDRIQ